MVVPDLSWVLEHVGDINMNVIPAGPGHESLANSGYHREDVDWNRTNHFSCPKGHKTDIEAAAQTGMKG